MGDVSSQAAYLQDCYNREFEAVVEEANGKYIVLQKTFFYPDSGGQPYDTGMLMTEDGRMFKVIFVGKFGNNISHELDQEGLKPGDKVKGMVDWERRYAHMRMHTAIHILCAVINKISGAQITGNQIGVEKTRIDFSLDNFDREQIKRYEEETNRIINNAHDVEFKFMSREDALEIPSVVKLQMEFPKDVETIRLVDIVGFDVQACGGTHVKNTSEVRGIRVIKAENKGRNNRRIYFELAGE
ncbi:alanyl-tRNA editing protein [Candidatus Woesearchaeota archaeon]|nr:alanyl-tRNA editing protein [Candidatus Woesearchaeota archaeon]